MYSEDSFFTLTELGQAGLIGLSALLSCGMAALVWLLVRGQAPWARVASGFALFWLFVWLSPQIYYAYYRLIIDGLPQQWVIGWPQFGEALRYLAFAGPASLSAHGQGVLGWSLLLLALFRR